MQRKTLNSKLTDDSSGSSLVIRSARKEDASDLRRLVKRSGVLDDNSDYCYLLLCTHFSEYCLVAQHKNQIVGFVTSYMKPDSQDTLFVWQIYVDPLFRRTGLALSMLQQLIGRSKDDNVKYLEATISPSNQSSEKLFGYFAEKNETHCRKEVFFNREDFSYEGHEPEVLHRIGPFE